MPAPRSFTSPRLALATVPIAGLTRRLVTCLLLTGLNAAVLIAYRGPLYQVSANHPLRILGVTLLFAAMLGSLARAAGTIEQTVSAFLEIGEAIATRWIQTSKGVLLLQMVADNPSSGAIYVFDRQRDDWYMLSFEGCEDQFTAETFDQVFSEYGLFGYVEQPGLLLSSLQPAHA